MIKEVVGLTRGWALRCVTTLGKLLTSLRLMLSHSSII